LRSVVNGSVILSLEPFHGFLLGNLVLVSNGGLASSSKTDSASWALKDNVEVHTEDTGVGIILKTKIDVLLNTEAKIA
jgi:predicted metalloprotease